MKKWFLVLMVLFMTFNVFAQKDDKVVLKGTVVKVKDWAPRAYLFKRGYWDKLQDVIVEQIGLYEFSQVKKFSSVSRMPYEMTLFKGFKKIDKAELAALDVKLGGLVAYRIASFSFETSNGVTKKRNILRVPYTDNKGWDSKAKWDTVYFVLPAELVEVVN